MKAKHIIWFLLLLIGCNSKSPETKHELEIVEQLEINEPKITVETKTESSFAFDNSVIPSNLISFIETEIDSLRIPTENDYETDNFSDKDKIPYFCMGYFDADSLLDYAMVLIKDSTNHYVFSFHANDNTFETFQLSNSPFLSEYNANRKYAVYQLETKTNRVVEAIDTTYILETDGINITDMYESRTSLNIWDSKKANYKRLSYD